MENQQGDRENAADQAATAKESLLESVNGGSQLVRTLFITYVATLAYVGLVVSATTHEMILRDSPVELPILGVALSLEGFYRWTPILLLILHANLLLQAYLLAEKIRILRANMDASGLRLCLHQFPFSHWLMLWEKRSWLHFTLSAVIWLFLVAAPLGLLYLMAEQYWVLREGRVWWVTLALLELLIILLFASLLKRSHQPLFALLPKRSRQPYEMAGGALWDQAWELPRWLWDEISSMARRLKEAPRQTLRQSGYQLFWILLPLLGGVFFTIHGGMKEASLQLSEAVLVDGELPAEVQFQVRQHRSGIGLAPEQGREEVPEWLKKVKGLELRGKNLKGTDFTGAWLINADFRKARGCVEADSEKANECMTDLKGANFNNALLVGALFDDLTGITPDKFEGADLRWANFRGVDFTSIKSFGCPLIQQDKYFFLLHRVMRTKDGKFNLEGVDFSQAVLCGLTMRKGFYRHAKFVNSSLNGSDLTEANLIGVDFTQANLASANLTKAKLNNSILVQANLKGAILDDADLSNARLWKKGDDYTIVKLKDVKSMRRSKLGPDLSGLKMSEWKLMEADLSGTDLTSVDLNGADLTGANLTNANLTGAKLENSILVKTNLKGAILDNANLTNAQLWEEGDDNTIVKLKDVKSMRRSKLGPDLSGLKMSGWKLMEADLSGVDLTRADLTGVDFTKAKLVKADLSDAILDNVVLDGANLRGAKLWKEDRNGNRYDPIKLSDIKSAKKARLGPDIKRLTVSGWRLSEADFHGVDFNCSTLNNVDFSKAILNKANFDEATLNSVNFEGAKLENIEGDVIFNGGKLGGSIVSLKRESKMVLRGVELTRARFSGSEGATVEVTGSNNEFRYKISELEFMNFKAAIHLTSLDLSTVLFFDGVLGQGSQFRDVTFKESVLCGINLTKVDMKNVRFSKTLLYKVDVPSCDLFQSDEKVSNYLEEVKDAEGKLCKDAKSMEWNAYLRSVESESYENASEACSAMEKLPPTIQIRGERESSGAEVSIAPPMQAGGLPMGGRP